MFDHVRKLFAETPEAKVRGYQQGRFSFNVKGGRCENCTGDGTIKIEMNFLPDVYVPCEVCHGARYNRETLEVHYKGKTIAEVLDMSIEEGVEFFAALPAIARHLKTLNEVGLGYVRLGQPAPTLSGGEAQRVKLASELQKRSTGRTLYVLDEPTTGLHFEDIRKLLGVLGRLVDNGNTVVVIEHNLDVIKTADWLIDMGPEGGSRGGTVIDEGTPEQIAANPRSYTGEFLRPILEGREVPVGEAQPSPGGAERVGRDQGCGEEGGGGRQSAAAKKAAATAKKAAATAKTARHEDPGQEDGRQEDGRQDSAGQDGDQASTGQEDRRRAQPIGGTTRPSARLAGLSRDVSGQHDDEPPTRPPASAPSGRCRRRSAARSAMPSSPRPEPSAGGGRPSRAGPFSTVSGDRAPAVQGEGHVGAGRVAQRVRQRLLDHPVGHGRPLRIERIRDRRGPPGRRGSRRWWPGGRSISSTSRVSGLARCGSITPTSASRSFSASWAVARMASRASAAPSGSRSASC